MKKLMISISIAILFLMIPHCALAKPDTKVTAGGVLFDGKGKDAQKITFGLNIRINEEGQYSGHVQVNFHNVLDDSLDKSKFKSASVNEIWLSENIFDGEEYHFIGVNTSGRFNNEDDWSLIIRMSDFGEPGRAKSATDNHSDAMRISVFNPVDDHVWDTGKKNVGYPREQSWRTLLNGGNVKAHY